jgi:hypothetical protein
MKFLYLGYVFYVFYNGVGTETVQPRIVGRIRLKWNRIWEERTVAYSKYYPGICPKEQRKGTKTTLKAAMSRPTVELSTLRMRVYSIIVSRAQA